MGHTYSIEAQRERSRTLRNILEDVEDYWGAFEKPVEFQHLSRRYAKRCKSMDTTFRRLLETLTERKLLYIQVHPTLRRSIWPMGAWEERKGYLGPERREHRRIDVSPEDE